LAWWWGHQTAVSKQVKTSLGGGSASALALVTSRSSLSPSRYQQTKASRSLVKRSPSGVLEGMLDHHRPPVVVTSASSPQMQTTGRCGIGGTLECGERTRAKTAKTRSYGCGGVRTVEP
jgi:hypothetical protein